jgi:chorismate-pyruvate lyase
VADAIPKNGVFRSLMLQNISEVERRFGIKLGLAQKTLLADNCTTEQVLNVLTGSTVKVKVVRQIENETTISRESVLIDGADRVLIRAHSKIFVSNLPKKIARQIRQQQLGIGTIITNSQLETFRKIIEVGYDPVKRSVFRRYQILYKKNIAFDIREELTGIPTEAR